MAVRFRTNQGSSGRSFCHPSRCFACEGVRLEAAPCDEGQAVRATFLGRHTAATTWRKGRGRSGQNGPGLEGAPEQAPPDPRIRRAPIPWGLTCTWKTHPRGQTRVNCPSRGACVVPPGPHTTADTHSGIEMPGGSSRPRPTRCKRSCPTHWAKSGSPPAGRARVRRPPAE